MTICQITNKDVREVRRTEDGVLVDADLHRLCIIKVGTALLTSQQIKEYLEKRKTALNAATKLIFTAMSLAEEKGLASPYVALKDILRRENAIAIELFKAESQTLNIEQAIECMNLLQSQYCHMQPVTWWQAHSMVQDMVHHFVSKKHWFVGYQ